MSPESSRMLRWLPICVSWMAVAIGFTPRALGIETLLVLKTSKEVPRISEGDLIELSDGRLCVVYSRFTGGGGDHEPADIAVQTSADGGRTWSPPRIVVPNEGKCNVMSVTVRRLKSGEILLFYLRKDGQTIGRQGKTAQTDSCLLFVRRSTDDLHTLSEPVRVTLLDGYHVVNNDRVLQCSTGRLIVPVALHTSFDADGKVTPAGSASVAFIYYSDDEGRTWHRGQTPITPMSERKLIVCEPGVVELKDGRLSMYLRTHYGSVFACDSSDGGLNWSEAKPISLVSPNSPFTIERSPWTGDLVCVWNDWRGDHPFRTGTGERTPLCLAVSHDDGQSWSKSVVLEDNPNGEFCYTSMTWQKDRLLLTYHDFTGLVNEPQSGDFKVVALSKEWLADQLPAAQKAQR